MYIYKGQSSNPGPGSDFSLDIYVILWLFTYRSVPGVFGNQQANHLDLIKQMMQQSLTEAAGYEVYYFYSGI